jgi:succinyl-diaminopimelate desuccinylase
MSNYSRLLEIFEKLVSFKTVEGNHKAMEDCLDYCEEILQKGKLHVNRYRSNGIPSLIATTHVTKKPKLLLQAHLDVLHAADSMFTIEGEGNRLVGRGVIDMKFAGACFLYLVEVLGERCEDFDFGIMFGMDEETDSLNGVAYLLEQGYSADMVLLPDGGNDWKVESSVKGNWWVRLVSPGRSAHASRPWLGTNPVGKLLTFMSQAEKLSSKNRLKGTTVVPTVIKAGKATNQIPDEAEGTLDIRFPTKKEFERVYDKLDKLGKKHKIRVLTIRYADAMKHDTDARIFKVWEEVVTEIRGEKFSGYMQSVAQSDAHYFVERGIPTLLVRPTGGDLHGPEEWIDEKDFYEYYECVKVFVERISAKTSVTPPGEA